MKKGLSILLVAAALFGFYGSAVNLNDILACKDYWEEAGEKSTADMNKLEDGLNQLKDNEQAYLDGLDAYADGLEQLAEGEAAYEAGPANIAAGRAALAEGEDALDSLKTLIDGIKQIHDGYLKLAAYEQLRDGRDNTVKALQDQTSDTFAASYKLTQTMGALAQKGIEGALDAYSNLSQAGAILGNPSAQKAGDYSDEQYAKFDEAMGYQIDGLTGAKTVLSGLGDKLSTVASMLPSGPTDTAKFATMSDGMTAALQYDELISMLVAENAQASGAWALAKDKWNNGATQTEKVTGAVYAYNVLTGAKSTLDENVEAITSNLNTATQAHVGYQTLIANDTLNAKKTAVGGVAQIISGVYGSGNKTLIKGFEKAAKAAGINLKDFQSSSTSKLGKDMKTSSSIDDFHNDFKKIDKAFQKAKATANKLKKNGEKQLKAGRAQLAQGIASYEAAPQQLAEGRAALADGKAQLDAYEDGEQQVRDGLATLFNTEADLDLESIADRLDGDGDFDNGDNHLELDEGLNAVEVGRGYQAEDGVLITNEIMARAVGTGALLGAGVLAVIAAILSFLKKNKGAGVFAILAACAGAFGAYYGTNAGTYFSDIAGSTAGNAGWVAAGILGAIALVHSIVHFTAKKEA